ncbi:MAG: GHKL domain-containing protein [Butyrivibrio sp.]|nr:GHKL domain-containing protein [Acetatifactor muris]MCM1558428.1 GHKL domain-containing protein [Butyrivibrio sp.]
MILWIAAGLLIFLGLLFGGRVWIGRLVDRRISHYQSDLLQRHCEEVENMYRQTRGWRHDYHNHIQTMKAYLAFGETDKLGKYLDRLDEDLTTVDTVIKTGNVMIDAVLNSKLSLAREKQIAVEAKAIVPPQLDISEVDLSLIIGNLMDNAMEACLRIEEENRRFIRVYIDIIKGQLYIYVMNAVNGRPGKKREENRQVRYLSTKDGRAHGFGLMRIDRVVARCKGYIDRQDEENVFATEILLPLVHE